MSGAGDMYRLAEDARGLLLETGLVVVPVDEPRSDQRRKQQRDDCASDDQVEAVQ
jgi:hypothetical protein